VIPRQLHTKMTDGDRPGVLEARETWQPGYAVIFVC
jgi:hypothetical protein